MPLRESAKAEIRDNLEKIIGGQKVPMRTIADLTEDQLFAINAERELDELPPIIGEVLFIGRHLYKSRMILNGYSIDEAIMQIESALSADSVFKQTSYMTAIENPHGRIDKNGKTVNDRAIMECSKKHPRPELLSVVPTGDGLAPRKQEKGRQLATLGTAVDPTLDSPG